MRCFGFAFLTPVLCFVAVVAPVAGQALRVDGAVLSRDSLPALPGPGRAFLYSVVVPGAGQWLLDQERWPPYAAFELWGWIQLVDSRSDGKALQRRYRDLAWLVARRVSAGPRRDGDFDYYEALANFRASGAFDADPSRAGVQPERDESTFNGSVWALARALFFPAGEPEPPEDSPQYRQALEYYRSRAYTPEYAWDWGENGLEQEAYARLIRDSDELLRRATIMLGVLLGNHLVSAIDALVSARLKAARLPPVRLQALFAPEPRTGERWLVVVRLLH